MAIDLKSLGLVPGPLTNQIQSPKSFVRGFIDRNFPEAPEISAAHNDALKQSGFGKTQRVHEHRIVSQLVGTAIDYRTRAYFDRNIHHAQIVRRGLSLLESLEVSREAIVSGTKLANAEIVETRWRKEKVGKRLIESYGAFVASVSPERRRLNAPDEELLCRYCVAFSYLDWIGRAPLQNSAIDLMLDWGRSKTTEMLAFFPTLVVEDVVTLSRRFFDTNETLVSNYQKAVVGGTLAGSKDVRGADFDLVVDGCLVEVKCRTSPKINTNDIRQLIAHWLLDYKDKLRIRKIAICNVRHGHMQIFNIRDQLLATKTSVTKLRQAFRTGLRHARHRSS